VRLRKKMASCALALALTGCSCTSCWQSPPKTPVDPTCFSPPREQAPASLPTYRVAPPDILLIEDMTNVRAADTRLQPGDQLTIRLLKGLPL